MMFISKKTTFAVIASTMLLPTASARFWPWKWLGGHEEEEDGRLSDINAAYYGPSAEFLFMQETGDRVVYLPNREDVISYIGSDEDDEGICSAGVCVGEYIAATIRGRITDDNNGFKFLFASTGFWSSYYIACPFPKMTPDITASYCPQTPETNLPPTSYTVKGAQLSVIQFSSGSCPTDDDYNQEVIVMEVTCTADDADDFPAMKKAYENAKDYTIGEDKKISRENIFVLHENNVHDSLVQVDGVDYLFENARVDFTGDTAFCSGTSCIGEDFAAFIHGPDNKKAVVYSNDEFEKIRFGCPFGDQTPEVNVVYCTNGTDPTVTATLVGPAVTEDLTFTGCFSDTVGIEIICNDP